MQKLARRVMPLAALVLLTGCVKDIVGIASCEVGNHVTISRNDRLTEQTASQIEKNNLSREAAGCIQRVASSGKPTS